VGTRRIRCRRGLPRPQALAVPASGAAWRDWVELRYDGDVAVPLTYRAVSNSDRDPRLFFGISKSFKFN
jgi:hypothetical protein